MAGANDSTNASSEELQQQQFTNGGSSTDRGSAQDAPPVFVMADGLSYLHVKRNGLIFGCSTANNISPSFVIEVGCVAMEYVYLVRI